MVNQKDVARVAKVSQATVSRYINNIGKTNRKSERKIVKAIKKLDYHRNLVARSLKLKQTNTLGFVFSDIKLPFFTDIIYEAEKIAYKNKYNVIIGNADNNIKMEQDIIKVFKERNMEGFLIEPVASNIPENYAKLIQNEKVVFVTRSTGIENEYSVILDNYEAMRLALEYLLKLGHKKIGIINIPLTITSGISRFAAYKEILAKNNITPDKNYIRYCDFTPGSAYEQAMDLLSSKDRPTALLTLSSRKTLETLKATKELGIKIPDELSIIGFDEFQTAELLDPPITIILQPFNKFGSIGIDMLFKLINGQPIENNKIVLNPELVVRESCKSIS